MKKIKNIEPTDSIQDVELLEYKNLLESFRSLRKQDDHQLLKCFSTSEKIRNFLSMMEDMIAEVAMHRNYIKSLEQCFECISSAMKLYHEVKEDYDQCFEDSIDMRDENDKKND